MVRAVHKDHAGIRVDYVNAPGASSRNHSRETETHPGLRMMRVVAVSFGLLCVLQVTLNVCLRVFFYTPNTRMFDQETVCKNVTPREDKLRKLTDVYFKEGWVYFHPSVYFISSTTKTWHESRKDCLQRQADLVIIDTKEEQDFTRQFHKLTWIGLYNNTVTGQWTWVDGTPLKKSYWGTGEPNKFEGKDEGCVEIRFFELENSWNDIPCVDRNFWICEKKYYI
uniref:C-type lectin domain-containing protein n=2 Tax=Nothobranchius korthausae TaxID=1143690 RepID=A0A1A8ET75_9TELE